MPRIAKKPPSSPRKLKKGATLEMRKKSKQYSELIKGKVIDLVRDRPEVWDTKNKDYSNRIIVDQIWDAFDTQLDLERGQARDCWTKLRTLFSLYRRKEEDATRSGAAGGSKKFWPFKDRMSFMTDHIERRRSSNSVSSSFASAPLNSEDEDAGMMEDDSFIADKKCDLVLLDDDCENTQSNMQMTKNPQEVDFVSQPDIMKEVQKHEKETTEKKEKKNSARRRAFKDEEDDDLLITKIADSMSNSVAKILSTPSTNSNTTGIPQDVRCFLDYFGTLLVKLDTSERIDFQNEVLGNLSLKVSAAVSFNKMFS